MDGYKAKDLAIREQDFADNNIRVHYLVPHSPDQLQPLDIQFTRRDSCPTTKAKMIYLN